MAKAVGLIGSLKGKVGNTVFATRRGIQIARVYQPVVAQPKSARQQLSRAKLTLATDTLRPFTHFLRAGWQQARPTYEFQQGVKCAIPVGESVITGTTPETVAVDNVKLAKVFSASGLVPLLYDELASPETSVVSMTVEIAGSNFIDAHGAQIGCGIVFAFYAPTLGAVIVKSRSDIPADVMSQVVFELPNSWSGVEVEVYGFCKQLPNAVNGITSTTEPWMYPAATSECVYIGKVTLA